MNPSLTLCLAALLPALTAPAQDWAKARLDKSPRHLEWLKVKQGQREVNCFVAYPEVKDKATVVTLIHEIFGLTDWVRDVADRLAEAGYIAIAPDLLSGTAPGGGLLSPALSSKGGEGDRVVAWWQCQEAPSRSFTIAFSSLSSLTVRSILARLKSLIGRPCTISSSCPVLWMGKELMRPFSTP